MADFKFEYNRAGFDELRRSPEMRSILSNYGERVRQKASEISGISEEEYEIETKIAPSRAYEVVRTASPHAYYSNRKHHTLQKAIGQKYD